LECRGVEATKEVQLAARKVGQDNIRLKALLRYKGVDEDTIRTWTPEKMGCGRDFWPRETCDSVTTAQSVRSFLAAIVYLLTLILLG
jgi:hypothetical protein